MREVPEELVEVLEAVEVASETAGQTLAGARATVDAARARYRDAGMTTEQQSGMVMAAAITSALTENPVIWRLVREDVLATIIITLAALK